MVKNTTKTLILCLLSAFFLLGAPAFSQVLFEENFSYPDGNILGQGGWTGTAGGITVSAKANLTLGSYPSNSGSGIALGAGFNPRVENNFAGNYTGDGSSAFLSLLYRTPATFTGYNWAPIYMNQDSGYHPVGDNRVGVGFLNTGDTGNTNGLVLITENTFPVFTHVAGTFQPNTVYHVVIEYQFVAGANNDVVHVYVSDAPIVDTLPAPILSKTTGEGDPLSEFGSIAILDDGEATLDGIRVTNTVGGLPVELMTFSVE